MSDDEWEDALPSFEKDAAGALSPEHRAVSERALRNADEGTAFGGVE